MDVPFSHHMLRAIIATGGVPLIRTPDCEETTIKKTMDTGVSGIVLPGISGAAMLRETMRQTKYAPEGTRGACPFRRIAAPARIVGGQREPHSDSPLPAGWGGIVAAGVYAGGIRSPAACPRAAGLGLFYNAPWLMRYCNISAAWLASSGIWYSAPPLPPKLISTTCCAPL